MGEHRFHAVPEGLAQAGRKAVHDAFHDPAQRIAFLLRLREGCVPLRSVGDPADFSQASLAAEPHVAVGLFGHGFLQDLLGNDAGRDDGEREPAGEMAAAPRILEAAVLHVRREVRMARARDVLQLCIIAAARIRIAENDRERSPRRAALVHPAEDVRLIGLDAGSRAFRTAPAPVDILREVLLAQFDTRLHAIQRDADFLSVRLAEDAYPENPSECIHNLSNISKNSGNDFATQAVSSISTGPSAPSEATLRAITIR